MNTERSLIWIAGDQPLLGKTLIQRLQHDCGSALTQAVSAQLGAQPIDLLWIGESLNIDLHEQLEPEQTADTKLPGFDIHYVEQANAARYLGTENKFIVFNALDKFDINAFAAICGTLVHAGTLYLLSRKSSDWCLSDTLTFSEFQSDGASIAGDQSPRASANPFIDRFTRILSGNTHKLTPSLVPANRQDDLENLSIRQLNARELPASSSVSATTSGTQPTAKPSSDQQQLITQLKDQLSAGKPFIAIITADRGRGKSAMLGWLLADLTAAISNTQHAPILVTGPARRAVAVLFKHFDAKQTTACNDKPLGCGENPAVAFYAPDTLLSATTQSDILVIDEAAALPLPILKKLLRKFPKVILATTVHGYEGAGRGFAIRLRQWLDTEQFSSQWLRLEQPVRWLQGDPLELLCDQIFLFKAALPEVPADFEKSACKIHCATPQELITNEALLDNCFALLLQAHYQTRPLDLYHLLSGANLKLYLLNYNDVPVALTLLATEGPFDDPCLRNDIVARKRRPRGHVLPQLLAQWIMRDAVLEHRFARVVRIAVHPQLQRTGLGSHLLQSIHTQLQKDKQVPVTAIGTLFGADPELVTFWKSNGYQTFHLGARKNNRSGERSIAMLKPLANATSTMYQFMQRAVALFNINFRSDLVSMHASKEAHSAQQIVEQHNSLSHQDTTPNDVSQSTQQLDYLEFVTAYVSGERSFHDTQTIILDYLSNSGKLNESTQLDRAEADIVSAIHQTDFSFTSHAKNNLTGGKKSSEMLLRTALKKLIDA